MSCPTENPTEALERQIGNLARDLARAIARIGELDVTRTLPGRLVWYSRAERDFKPGNLWEVHCQGCHRPRYSTDSTGRCFTCRAVAAGVPMATLVAPVDPTRQGGLEAWPRPVRVCFKCGLVISSGWVSFTNHVGEFCGPCWDPKRYPRVLDVDTALANGDSR